MDIKNISSTFLKGIDVLRCFKNGETDLTMADISKRVGYDRATVRRLCFTLVEAGLLFQHDRTFSLSPSVMTFAGSFLQANKFGSSIQPLLNRISTEIEGEVSLAVLDNDSVLYLAHSATKDARVSIGLTIGSTLPIIPTATGRMLLASLSKPHRQEIIERLETVKHTPVTIVDKAEIQNIIDQARNDGFSIVNGEYEPGICAIAVPISNNNENIASVLGTTLPMNSPKISDKKDQIISALQIAASNLHRLNLFPK